MDTTTATNCYCGRCGAEIAAECVCDTPVAEPKFQPRGHTPGPWHVAHEDELTIWAANPALATGMQTLAYVEAGPSCYANASLIEAAPDLLAALKESDEACLFALMNEGHPAAADRLRSARKQARAAIAKAEGGAS